jgi:hypothetical protein
MNVCAKPHRSMLYGICIFMLMACISACAPVHAPAPLPPVSPIPPAPEAPRPEPEQPPPQQPRHMASVQLTQQARMLIERKSYDDAIRVLERAISLNPRNGENYYHMAEAWYRKGNQTQAAEFNRLAGMYLSEPPWKERVEHQHRAIQSRSK